ncbi:hypothetical protein [Photobacterium damselae]|uniref:hypothetical protein n=1 Tax=Photobacterium damselae TaxID=38293 RepID=UPI001F2CE8ED|nr:hypothetical protein [Photobacterium damselae]UKA04479.1 hypothetical protein IHC89_22920 [Photobacterium damselae subsp. damselae]
MYYIGYLIYAAAIAATALSPAAVEMVEVSYRLATTITIGCFVLAAYPPLLLMYYMIRGLKNKNTEDHFAEIVKMTSATVVSLGLVGTFIGLTQMITKISSAISYKGKSMEDQVQHVMSAIGASLDSMSFAFLTSVMGVASAVVITCAATYFREFFKTPIDQEVVGIDSLTEKVEELEESSKNIFSILNRFTSVSVDRNELASLVISNSLQTRELAKIISELNTESTNKVEIDKKLIEALSESNRAMAAIEDVMGDAKSFANTIAGKVGEIAEDGEALRKSVDAMKRSREQMLTAIASQI